MKKLLLSTFTLAILITACKKSGFNPLTDTKPIVPVNVLNVYGWFNTPAVAASNKDSIITIQLGIPSESGKTIKEITRVAYANALYGARADSALKNVTKFKNDTLNGIYTNVPIPGNGNSVTFKSSFAEFRAITKLKAPAAVPLPTAVTPLLSRYFLFLITLNDGTQIIPEPIRVIVTP